MPTAAIPPPLPCQPQAGAASKALTRAFPRLSPPPTRSEGRPRLAGPAPGSCHSPSVNKALIGCCPVRIGPPEKSNYWPGGFQAARPRDERREAGDRFQDPRGPAGRRGRRGAVESRASDQRSPERKGPTRARGPAGRPCPRGHPWPGLGARVRALWRAPSLQVSAGAARSGAAAPWAHGLEPDPIGCWAARGPESRLRRLSPPRPSGPPAVGDVTPGRRARRPLGCNPPSAPRSD